MINRDTFSVEQWAQIISAPASVGAMVVTADPSGPLGLIGEFRAIMTGMKEYVEAHDGDGTLMGALYDYMQTKPSEEEEAQLKEWAQEQQAQMKTNRPQNPAELKEHLRRSVAGVLELLQSKGATEADVRSFKDMMAQVAESVANASKEGGFLGFGGELVSDREASVLAEIRTELGV